MQIWEANFFDSLYVKKFLIFLFICAAVLFFAPEMGGYFLEHENFRVADSLNTPDMIVPVWYMTPFYAMLRAVPDKLMGVIVMGASIFILFLLPWLDRSPVRSLRYRGCSLRLYLSLRYWKSLKQFL